MTFPKPLENNDDYLEDDENFFAKNYGGMNNFFPNNSSHQPDNQKYLPNHSQIPRVQNRNHALPSLERNLLMESPVHKLLAIGEYKRSHRESSMNSSYSESLSSFDGRHVQNYRPSDPNISSTQTSHYTANSMYHPNRPSHLNSQNFFNENISYGFQRLNPIENFDETPVENRNSYSHFPNQNKMDGESAKTKDQEKEILSARRKEFSKDGKEEEAILKTLRKVAGENSENLFDSLENIIRERDELKEKENELKRKNEELERYKKEFKGLLRKVKEAQIEEERALDEEE